MKLEEDKNSKSRSDLVQRIKEKAANKLFSCDIKLGNEGMQVLGDALYLLNGVEKMDLVAHLIGDPGISTFSHAVIFSGSLQALSILDLRRNDISDKGIRLLARACLQLPNLSELYFSDNKLGSVAGSLFGEVLNRIPKLRILQLSKNELLPGGVSDLAKALSENSSLETFYLNGVKAEDEGMKALAKALITNTCLKNLHLQSNSIGLSGVEAMREVLKSGQNKTLVLLDIRYNKFGQAGEIACRGVEEMLKERGMKLTYN